IGGEESLEENYKCWLQYKSINNKDLIQYYHYYCSQLLSRTNSKIIDSAINELQTGITEMIGNKVDLKNNFGEKSGIILSTAKDIDLAISDYNINNSIFSKLNDEGFLIKTINSSKYESGILIVGKTDKGVLYGTFCLLHLIQKNEPIDDLEIYDQPENKLRMINQWDNIDGTIERGYSGKSIFFKNNEFIKDKQRLIDYARLLASIGINAISINNVNVWDVETKLITKEYLYEVQKVVSLFRTYGIKTFLSVNYASPITLGELETADPLDEDVQNWWQLKVSEIYNTIPDFGGFIVKADSEGRPGPFSYNRNHAEGANMLAKALKKYDGILIWRCFVYNHLQDWRDRKTDRARAAYDNFISLDGHFENNVILQVKNGPMDFQVREPVSPLIGAMKETNQMLELQITQEYTGQQIDVCYLIPQWKEILNFETYSNGEGSQVKNIINGINNNKQGGIAAVSNIGADDNWTGNGLAQANLYGYGRLLWNPDLSTDMITTEWINLTFGNDGDINKQVKYILLKSWQTYENYTAPLGVGWMVNPHHHYGPNIDGYEYSAWGTYHFADRQGIGVDRTEETGTGFTSQYFQPNKRVYESLHECPDELLLFFHHVPYSHILHSGKTVIQHIYDTHFKGVDQVEEFIRRWSTLEGKINNINFSN